MNQKTADRDAAAVFFDRDGVLNEDLGYVHRACDVKWCEGAMDAVKFACDQGYRVFVVTNQSGVARGLYQEADVARVHQWMRRELLASGARVDEFRYCPHHPEAERTAYRLDCPCRKPRPGMLLDLIRRWRVDPALSLLIGNREIDLQAARAAGVRGALYGGGDLQLLLARELAGIGRDAAC